MNPQAGANLVDEGDRAAWRAVPVAELERHPKFLLLPRETRALSDGSEVWDFVDCSTTASDVHCSSTTAFKTTATSCTDRGSRTFCCHNQFFVRAGVVEDYRPGGSGCQGGCATRPGGSCAPATASNP